MSDAWPVVYLLGLLIKTIAPKGGLKRVSSAELYELLNHRYI
jgi:hypothetical protein